MVPDLLSVPCNCYADMTDRRPQPPLPSYGEPLREMAGPYRARNRMLVAALRVSDLIGRLHPRRRGRLPQDRPIRVLVANWGHLGDVVTILPLLEFLKNHPRVGKVGLLIGSWSRPIVVGVKAVDVVHALDNWLMVRSDQGRLQKFLAYRRQKRQVVGDIIREGYDVSIDLFSTFPSTHRVMWQAKVPVRIGFASSGFGTYLTHAYPWDVADEYVLNKQIRLLAGVIDNVPPTLAPVYPNFTPERSAIELLAQADRFILMHFGSGDVRGWIPEKWIALGRALKQRGWHIVLTGAKGAEADNARAIEGRFEALNLAGLLSWREFATVVSKATAVISVDTVTGHLAACFQVPAVVLMTGRTNSQLWRPNQSSVRPLMHPVGCAPCHRTRGCDTMACVRFITVEEVLASLDGLLGAHRPSGIR